MKQNKSNIYETMIMARGYKEQWEIVCTLYDNLLKDDPNWHFFYEPYFVIVRFSAENKSKIEKMLGDLFNGSTVWVDCSTVEKYKDYFTKLFHMNCEFVLSNRKIKNKNEVYAIFERMEHTLFEAFAYQIAIYLKMTEETLLSNMAVRRAFLNGYSTCGYEQVVKNNKNKL